jgi:ABC-type sugar transport system substrate-binding protein
MSNEHGVSDILGKKIFFLYPSALIQNQIVAELIQQEYEVYIVRDHVKLRNILKRYPDSVVFVNINDQMPEKDWETWIRAVMGDSATAMVRIGVISTNDDDALQRKYINSIRVQCGYTVLQVSLNSAMKQLLDILRAVDAKGRRKYIRATLDEDVPANINVPINGTYVNGTVKDISVVGLSCFFGDDPGFAKNSLFQDIQIKLQSMILKAEGIVFGSRMDGLVKIYVIIFTQRIDPDVRTRIRKYIQQNMQAKLDAEMT